MKELYDELNEMEGAADLGIAKIKQIRLAKTEDKKISLQDANQPQKPSRLTTTTQSFSF